MYNYNAEITWIEGTDLLVLSVDHVSCMSPAYYVYTIPVVYTSLSATVLFI